MSMKYVIHQFKAFSYQKSYSKWKFNIFVELQKLFAILHGFESQLCFRNTEYPIDFIYTGKLILEIRSNFDNYC